MKKTVLSDNVRDILLCDESVLATGGFDVVPAGWDLVRFVDSKLKDCKYFIDIGANVGSFTLLAKGYPDVKFLSFEPVKKIFSILEKNVNLNEIKNVTLINKGLSDVEEDINIYIPTDNNIGSSSIYKIDYTECDVEMCSFDKLDNYMDYPAELIKIDVEGHEYKVLTGGMEFLKKYHPMILMEDNPPSTEEQFENQRNIFTLLDSLGYKLYQFNVYNVLAVY